MKIPDDVFLARCKFCIHNRPEAENIEIPEDKLFAQVFSRQSPCGIIGIAQCNKVQGECLDFKPRPMFGICEYCAFTNSFHAGFCTFPGGPLHKRQVFLGWSGIGDYYGKHALFTCDCYQASAYWKDLILKNTVEGRAPANFDPDTWEPLERLDGTAAAKKWSELQERRNEELESEKEKESMEREKREQKQISMFDEC